MLRTDGEPAIRALAEAAKTRRKKHVDREKGSLEDSASMDAIEGKIRWWQAKVRTFRYDLEKRYAVLLTADDPMWYWLTRYAGWATSVYRVRGDGVASYKAAFGVSYTGKILPFGETALFKVPESHTRQVSSTMTRNKGDSAFVKGSLGGGKHKESGDHIFLTAG